MIQRKLTLSILSMAALAGQSQAQFFSDNFDDGAGSSRWTVLGQDLSSQGDFGANMAFNYGTLEIPSAPLSTSTTIGAFMTANDASPNAAAAVAAFPTGQSFGGNYSFAFDMWMNVLAGGNSTELMLAGINCSDTQVNWANNTGSQGFLFMVTGEGGSARDYRSLNGNAEFVWSVANPVGGYRAPYVPTGTISPQEAFNPYYLNVFPGPTYPNPATPANQWVRVEITQNNGYVEWRLNGWPIVVRQDTAFVSGNVQLGYADIFTSMSNAALAGIFDNASVAPIINVSNYTVLQGEEFAGGTGVMDNLDGQYLSIFNDPTNLTAQVVLEGTSQTISPSFYQVMLEGLVARPGLSQTLEGFNFTAGSYQVLAGETASAALKATTVVRKVGASDFTNASGDVRSRITWLPINDEDPSQDGWLHNVDVFRWRLW